MLEDCSPVALQQKANQTSSCRGHERSSSPFPLYCVLYSNPYTRFHQAHILRPVSFLLERSLSILSSILGRRIPSTFSLEKVFQCSAVQASRATRFLHSPILAEDQINLQPISLEALLKKLPYLRFKPFNLSF